ncbi:MAG: thioredoxin family protein [Candidatus Pseudobacter hemicellulosilyticus]|uniref:Thioredoxin family protein n=1 Tax=Candidatus Pseudobacter hemicellulosilyticus TaxID=3121375 RepID=A0AAJ5WVW1_9BACT|nr:MAG: thioredoxin family protein [Pseudobacter sp.]
MNKLVLTSSLLFLFILNSLAQSTPEQGMQFFQGNWKELISSAQKENKLIFVDVYTDWCAPCKLMARNVFPKAEAGAAYNPRFINYKLNAEKGEGIDLARKFNITAYPTFLFLNSNGFLVQKIVGEKELAGFIALTDQAVTNAGDPQNLGNLEEKFSQGVRDTAFLRNYIRRLSALDLSNSQILDEYFKNIPHTELQQESILVFFGQQFSNTQSVALPYFLEQYPKLGKAARQQISANLYHRVIVRGLNNALRNSNMLEAAQLFSLADRMETLSPQQRLYVDRLRFLYLEQIRDTRQFIITGHKLTAGLLSIPKDSLDREDQRRFNAIMQPYLSGEKDSSSIPGFQEERLLVQKTYTKEITGKLYTVASKFLELPVTETKALADALTWARRAFELEPDQKVFADLVKKLTEKTTSPEKAMPRPAAASKTVQK